MRQGTKQNTPRGSAELKETLLMHQDGVDEAAELGDEGLAGEGIRMAVELAEPTLMELVVAGMRGVMRDKRA